MPEFTFKLAAIDLDETLLGPDKEISAENRQAIHRLVSMGVQIVLASGRRYENMVRYAAELGLDGPMITAQGSRAVLLDTGEIVYDCPLSREDSRTVIETGLSRGLTVLAYHDDATYANERNRLTDLYDRRSGDAGAVTTDLTKIGGPIMKVLWLAEADVIPEHIAWAAENLKQVHTVATDPEYLELMDWGANKAEALKAIALRLGVDQGQILAFGDGNNDSSMLEWAGLGIAMPHGTQAAHDAADRVGPDGAPESALARSIGALIGA